jgi:hypothetical protein
VRQYSRNLQGIAGANVLALFLSRGSRRLKFVLVALVLLLSSAAPAQTVQYKPLPPEIIQARLQKSALALKVLHVQTLAGMK